MKRFLTPLVVVCGLLLVFAAGCQSTSRQEQGANAGTAVSKADGPAVRYPEAIPDEPWYLTRD
ncbi:MAG: hypothetical protein JXM70_19005 [Pirellulales bacterium]|nr:hypothetical protein [Pirellulales bacterium]